MKIMLLSIGKDKEEYLKEGIDDYMKRIKKYISFEYKILPGLKKTAKSNVHIIKRQESEKYLEALPVNAHLILLDEKGKHNSSMEFSRYLSKLMLTGKKNIAFVIGGAYGFDDIVYKRSDDIISLSKMTFNYQLVRMVFLEQLYRAFTIIHNEPYHNI